MQRLTQGEVVEVAANCIEKCTPVVNELSKAKKALFAQWRSGQSPAARRSGRTIPRRPDAPPAPLSLAQEQAWFFSQLQPDSPLYNIPLPMRWRGHLDLSAFQKALDALVARHPIFRTQFGEDEFFEPVQLVEEPSPVPVNVTDLRDLPEALREEELCRWLREEIRQPFDLARDLMIRVRLLQIGEDDWGVSIVLHHIAGDFWSLGVLCRELEILYRCFLEGRPAALPELPIHYGDFAAWQQEWLRGSEVETHLAWWQQNLIDAPTVLDLPFARARPATQTFHGACEFMCLPAGLRLRLVELSRREGVTPFMTLLAGFQALLHGYTGREDLLIGSPAAGRGRAELEGVIGFFANVLVLRTSLEGNPTFRELLCRTRNVVLEALDHQEVPFARVVQELRPQRSASHLPFFQIVFMLQEELAPSVRLPGLRATDLEADTGTAKFDLLLSVLDGGESLKCCAEYNTDLFAEASIRRMLEQYQSLLESILAQPDRRLSDLASSQPIIHSL
jgi:hypothetical protein